MNAQALLHIPESNYCFPVDKNEIVLRFRTDRNDCFEQVEVVYESKYFIYERQKSSVMQLAYQDKEFNYYETKLTLDDVRLAYVFRLTKEGKTYYFSEDRLTKEYDFSLAYYNSFQVAYINENDVHQMVPWMKRAVFYQIFPDRFCMKDEKKDKSYITWNWGDIPKPKGFAGGDLQGIISKLDYLKELGITALYLNPIFKSISNHKYDIEDYKEIDPMFGTKEDFKELVQELHKRNMKIVLDAVFNHCSSNLKEFQDVVSKGKDSQYFDWFVIHGDYVDMDHCNYEVFSSCEYMPKFNTSNVHAQDFLIDIATYWIKEYDIDGWRLDVSDEVSHEFWRRFRREVKMQKDDFVIIGENWHDANSYLRGDQYDSIMNYAFTKACLDYYVFETLDAEGLANKLSSLILRNTDQVNRMMLNLLDCHDVDRFYTRVNKNKNKLLSALAVTNMFIGTPCVYYGTEIPLEGGFDPDNRRCFDWDESHWDQAYMSLLKQILHLRTIETVQNGNISFHTENDVFYLSRREKDQEVILITNESGVAKQVQIEGNVVLQNLYEDHTLKNDGFVVVKVDRNK